jgi:plastocyanin
MQTPVLSLALVLALGGGAAVAQSGSPAPSPAAPPSTVPPAGAVVVHIKDFAYKPESVTIRPGQSVRFVEDDETPHTVTATDKSFDSGNLDKGRSWTHTFASEGTYAYLCAYHPYMKGKVVVKAP